MLPGMLRGAFDYDHWPRTVNGKTAICDNYATTQLVDDALAWIEAREKEKKPWLCYLAFNAAHSPFHRPPAELHSQDPKELDPNKDAAGCYRAVVKAPFLASRAKGTVFEGGINVPLIVAGPAVKGKARECDALVSITDLFATTLELCAVEYRKHLPKKLIIDASSFVPHLTSARHGTIRNTVFSEIFQGNRPEQSGQAAIRNERYKLLRNYRGGGRPLDRFFDLQEDPFERNDLMRDDMSPLHTKQYLALKQELERLRATRRKN